MYEVSYGQEGGVLIGPDNGSSEQVKEWQSYLVKKGYDIGRWCIDGDFGSATQAATRALGRDLNVDTSGSVTMPLWNAASRDYNVFMEEVTTAHKDAACPGWRTPPSTPAPSTAVAKSSESSSPPAPGPIGKVADAAWSPRGIVIGGSILVLGAGLFLLLRDIR